MGYWGGWMDWPTVADWTCHTCGSERNLEWGIVHGMCRCITCHTQYRMRNLKTDVITDRPELMLKPEYVIPAKLAWESLRKPIDQLAEEEWQSFMEEG